MPVVPWIQHGEIRLSRGILPENCRALAVWRRHRVECFQHCADAPDCVFCA